MDAAEKKLLKEKAHRIADVLGETGDVPRAQLYRILRLMGEPWVRMVVGEVEKLAATSATITARPDGSLRTIGGMFFKAARTIAWAAMERGEIARPDFRRAVHGWPERERPPRPPAPSTSSALTSPPRVRVRRCSPGSASTPRACSSATGW